MNTYIDTGETWHCRNIAIWWDGSLRPAKGHYGDCMWLFDGQFYYHAKSTNSKEDTDHKS